MLRIGSAHSTHSGQKNEWNIFLPEVDLKIRVRSVVAKKISLDRVKWSNSTGICPKKGYRTHSKTYPAINVNLKKKKKLK